MIFLSLGANIRLFRCSDLRSNFKKDSKSGQHVFGADDTDDTNDTDTDIGYRSGTDSYSWIGYQRQWADHFHTFLSMYLFVTFCSTKLGKQCYKSS